MKQRNKTKAINQIADFSTKNDLKNDLKREMENAIEQKDAHSANEWSKLYKDIQSKWWFKLFNW